MRRDAAWLRANRPRRYWFAIFSRERREARRSAPPQPVRYARVSNWMVRVDAPRHRDKLPPQSMPMRNRLCEAQGDLCYLCGREMAAPTEDHVLPRARGGRDKANRLMACPRCNNVKGARLPYPCELLYLQAINLRVVRREKPWKRGGSYGPNGWARRYLNQSGRPGVKGA